MGTVRESMEGQLGCPQKWTAGNKSVGWAGKGKGMVKVKSRGKCSRCGQPVTGGHNKRTCGKMAVSGEGDSSLPLPAAPPKGAAGTGSVAGGVSANPVNAAYSTVAGAGFAHMSQRIVNGEGNGDAELSAEELAVWWALRDGGSDRSDETVRNLSRFINKEVPPGVRQRLLDGNPDLWKPILESLDSRLVDDAVTFAKTNNMGGWNNRPEVFAAIVADEETFSRFADMVKYVRVGKSFAQNPSTPPDALRNLVLSGKNPHLYVSGGGGAVKPSSVKPAKGSP